MTCRIGLLLVWTAGAIANVGSTAHAADCTLDVDWRSARNRVNRGIFSTQGFMQVYVEPDPMVLDTFQLINPRGTSTRLEIYIHRLEPENDNADPKAFDWNRLYPDRMIRFIDHRATFEQFTFERLGMEPLALLCYNAPWLTSGNPDDIVRNHLEWAEFAAGVVEAYNGRGHGYTPKLQYVEVWNEPNFAEFRMGTPDAYFDLFGQVADRIHRDYPGVQVGGPAISHAPTGDPEAWMDAFLKRCAHKADFLSWHHYGPQGEPVDRIINDLTSRMERFRQIPGKENGKAMITEIDAWFHGFPKMQHIFERQFRLLDHADLIHSVHHFCCLAYSTQGNYTFGVVRTRGGVMPGVFWPYWLFRNFIGHESPVVACGPRASDLRLIASRWSDDDLFLGTAVMHNKSRRPVDAHVRLRFAPDEEDRVLAIERVAADFQGPERVLRIAAGRTDCETDLTLGPGEAMALTLRDAGVRSFAFRDLNNQETPWIALTADKDTLTFHDSCALRVRVLNAGFEDVSGRIVLQAFPKDWTAEVVQGSERVDGLAFGLEHECVYRITAASVVDEGSVSPYAVLETAAGTDIALDRQAHSIPAFIQVKPPYIARVLPSPIRAIPGETNEVAFQILNRSDAVLTGRLTLEPPKSFKSGAYPRTVEVPARSRRRFLIPFEVPHSVAAGESKGAITLHALEVDHREPFSVTVTQGRPPRHAVPLDLTHHMNIDAMAFDDDRMQFDIAKVGQFAFPADFVPSGRVARVRGVPFRLASLDGRDPNAVEPRGQRIRVPAGRYTRVAFLGFGHSGKHHGTWSFHYTDGSVRRHASQVPEWCCPAPDGPENFMDAFNAPYRYIQGGPAPPACQLFMWSLPADPAKELDGMELPAMTHAYLFAITVLHD